MSQTITPHLMAWRHPRPAGVQGRCIGRTDVPVDARKVKRLAHRIRQVARRHQWPRVIHTSPLQRCAAVGRQLRRWGWHHHVDTALLEMDFGAWDGLHWAHIAHQEVNAWCQDFAAYAPGQGESLHAMLARAANWLNTHAQADHKPVLVVAHAGWMLATSWVLRHEQAPEQASHWPAAPVYGQCQAWPDLCVQYRPVAPAIHK
jgi:alpha-ribazole phosphatase